MADRDEVVEGLPLEGVFLERCDSCSLGRILLELRCEPGHRGHVDKGFFAVEISKVGDP